MPKNVRYWLEGGYTQNFGDFLSEFLMERLFYGVGLRAHDIRIIGSCIDDGLLDPEHPLRNPAACRIGKRFSGAAA